MKKNENIFFEEIIETDLESATKVKIKSLGGFISKFGFEDYLFDFDELIDSKELISPKKRPRLYPNGKGYYVYGIKVTDQNGNPIPGQRVTFKLAAVNPKGWWRNVDQVAAKYGSKAAKLRKRVENGQIKLIGQLSNNSAITDAGGIASVKYTVSNIGGNQSSIAQEKVIATIPKSTTSQIIDIGLDYLNPISTISGGTRIVGATGRYIHKDLNQFLVNLGNSIKKAKWKIPLTITAGTLKWGGLYPPHFTHTIGVSLDFRPMSKDGKPTWCRTDGTHASNYDREKTLILVDIFKKAGANPIYFNDPKAKKYGARPLSGHHNHLHVSWLSANLQSNILALKNEKKALKNLL